MRRLLPGIAGFAAVLGGAALASCSGSFLPLPKCKGVEIADLPVEGLQKLMTEGRLTSRDLVECYLARIEQTNNYTHSISEVNPDALSIADALDAERTRLGGSIRGPMHGIPFLVKDNFYTEDRHNTSEGTLALLGGRYAGGEATVVAKIRAAGGVLLGHATMSEAADHRALADYASGYSSRTGQTRNPYNLTQPTAGSSSGSVVAVRINQVAIAIGTETYGSLVHPAAQLGLYTVKSTPGLMSRHGIVTGSYYHDTPGPLARSMKDVAMLLDIMHGPDPRDNLTYQAIGKYPGEGGYTAHVADKSALRGMKFGLPWDPYWSTNAHMNSPGVRQVYEKRIKELEEAGAQIYNITKSPFTGLANEYGAGQHSAVPAAFQHSIAFATLLAAGYGEWLRDWTFPEGDPRRGAMRSVDDVAAWNVAHNATTGALGNGTWWWGARSGQSFYDAAVATRGALNGTFWTAFGWGRTTARQAIDEAHAWVASEKNGTTGVVVVEELDGLLVPNGRAGGYSSACAPLPSYAGYPVASVPVGLDGFATPFALGVYGRQFGEARLVAAASALEDLFRWREAPAWHNAETAREHDRPWDAPWPGYTCSKESLARYACTK